MDKYKTIQQLMAEGEFRKARKLLAELLQKNPDDKAAKQLEFTCREMLRIQDDCMETPKEKNDISVQEYFSVHFRKAMKAFCSFAGRTLSKLPPSWQQKISADRFKTWKENFTVEADSQKDWLWELLFWDAKRRMILFSSLIAALLLAASLLILLCLGSCNSDVQEEQGNLNAIIREAEEDNAHAQYLLGKKLYYGEGVRRNVDFALTWLTRSAKSGYEPAGVLLQKIMVEQENSRQEGTFSWKKKK